MSHCVVGLRACFKMCNPIYTSMINRSHSLGDLYKLHYIAFSEAADWRTVTIYVGRTVG